MMTVHVRRAGRGHASLGYGTPKHTCDRTMLLVLRKTYVYIALTSRARGDICQSQKSTVWPTCSVPAYPPPWSRSPASFSALGLTCLVMDVNNRACSIPQLVHLRAVGEQWARFTCIFTSMPFSAWSAPCPSILSCIGIIVLLLASYRRTG
jgi:hypothetical protein